MQEPPNPEEPFVQKPPKTPSPLRALEGEDLPCLISRPARHLPARSLRGRREGTLFNRARVRLATMEKRGRNDTIRN